MIQLYICSFYQYGDLSLIIILCTVHCIVIVDIITHLAASYSDIANISRPRSFSICICSFQLISMKFSAEQASFVRIFFGGHKYAPKLLHMDTSNLLSCFLVTVLLGTAFGKWISSNYFVGTSIFILMYCDFLVVHSSHV